MGELIEKETFELACEALMAENDWSIVAVKGGDGYMPGSDGFYDVLFALAEKISEQHRYVSDHRRVKSKKRKHIDT